LSIRYGIYNKNKLSFIKVFIEIVTNNTLLISIDILILQSGWGKDLDCERFAQEGHKKKNSTYTSCRKMWDVNCVSCKGQRHGSVFKVSASPKL